MKPSVTEDVAERQAVVDVLVAYSWAIDTGNCSRLAGLFAGEGEFRGSDGTVSKGREELEAFAARVHGSRPYRLQHVTSNHEFTFTDRQTVEVRSYVHIFGCPPEGAQLLAFGSYDDVLTKVDGAWLFTSRAFNSWSSASL